MRTSPQTLTWCKALLKVGSHIFRMTSEERSWMENAEMQQRKQRKDLTQRTHQTGLHSIKLLTLLGKTWLRQGLWNVLMGHILDPRRVTGNFQKPTVIAFYQMGERIERDWFVLFQEKNPVFFTCSSLSSPSSWLSKYTIMLLLPILQQSTFSMKLLAHFYALWKSG